MAACAEPPVTPQPALSGINRTSSVDGSQSYLVLMNGNSITSGFSVSVGSVGGTVTGTMDKIGVAVVSSSDPSFATKAASIKGVAAVVPNVVLHYGQPRVGPEVSQASVPPASGNGFGDAEPYRPYQWALRAINARAAWNSGALGAGARVAVVDGGMYSAHVDIAPNLDVAHSRSYVQGWNYNQDEDEVYDANGNVIGCQAPTAAYTAFWHATHVGGIIAAAANGTGTLGVAPAATLISVKALHCGSGDFGAVIAAIYYAATPISEGGAGANIINMSLGALLLKNGIPGAYTARDASYLLNALSRATSYANQRNVTVIASAGNDAVDLDHTADWVSVPAQSVGVVTVSATAPEGFIYGATNFDRPSSYTNYGQSAIDLAAPGGDFTLAYQGDANYVFDMVLAPCRGKIASTTTYCFAAGTSMAAPHVAGVAALIVARHPGLSNAGVEAILRGSSDDLGKPGNDDYYGAGRVNAGRAAQQ